MLSIVKRLGGGNDGQRTLRTITLGFDSGLGDEGKFIEGISEAAIAVVSNVNSLNRRLLDQSQRIITANT